MLFAGSGSGSRGLAGSAYRAQKSRLTALALDPCIQLPTGLDKSRTQKLKLHSPYGNAHHQILNSSKNHGGLLAHGWTFLLCLVVG